MQQTQSRRQLLWTLGAVGTAPVAGCLGTADDGAGPSTLRVGLGWRVLDSLDPVESGLGSRVHLYESLIGLDHDGEFVPRLATEWGVEDDDRTWWFELDEAAQFHDGSPVTADAVSRSLERSFADAPDFDPVPVEAVGTDGDRVTITTAEPFAPLLGYLTLAESQIVSPATLDSENFAEPIGAGPFQFESWESDQQLTVTAFDDYYDGRPEIDRIAYEFVHDDQTRTLKLQNGELHLGRSIPESSISALENDPETEPVIYDVPRMRFLVFNNASGPFADLETRQAVNYAIDRDAIIEGPLEGTTEPAIGPIPPSMSSWANQDLEGYSYDPEQARALLEEAGWEVGDDGVRVRDGERFEITLWGYPSHEIPIVAEVLQAQFAAVGIEMDIRITEYGTLSDAKERGEFDLSMESWATIMGGDLDRMLRYFHSTETLIDSGYDNPRVDELIEEGRRTLEVDDRKELYDEIQEIVLEEVPVAFISYYARIAGVRNELTGFEPHPIEYEVDLRTARLEAQ